MPVANLYFDESGTHSGARLMVVAGYWFDSEQAFRFSRDWEKALKKLGLPFAHMTDCALGYGIYKELSLAERIESEKLLIENIKRRSRLGFAIIINPDAYADIMKDIKGAPSCYTYCLISLVHNISLFADRNNYKGKLVYFFEAGHESAKEANSFLRAIPSHGPAWVQATRYSGHSFVDKRDALPLQAADMLAWQVRHFFERKLAGHTKPRKDLVAMVRKFDITLEIPDERLVALKEAFLQIAPLAMAGDNVGAAFEMGHWMHRHGLSMPAMPRVSV